MLRRALTKAALAASLILAIVLPVASRGIAAPPEPIREATTASLDQATMHAKVAADAHAGPDSLAPTPRSISAPVDGDENQPGEVSKRVERASADSGSVRPRGLEAPVDLKPQEGQVAELGTGELLQTENTNVEPPRAEKRDPGDGPVRKRAKASQEQVRAPQGIRVWPMPADSYTFTQQFGCVPQLGNLYFPGEGCPAEAPVIHTGIDLAAPEGTLFYAAASGWVTLADYDRPTPDANTRIIIQHDGRNERYASDYLHWIASYVEEGDYVHAGDPIGEVGSVGFSTGPHLHFSVTDLDTGEHIDPLRWLPEELGLEGYVSRRPTAQLRLPAGTTAGQPESADPAPPPPPVREDVPTNPPDESGHRERSERRDDRKDDQRRSDKGDNSETDKADLSGNKRSRDEATSSGVSDESGNEKSPEHERSRERVRTRERNKDGSTSDTNIAGEDTRNRDSRDDTRSGNHRRDRDSSDSSSGDNQERNDDSGQRDKDVEGGQSDSGGRDQRASERRGEDHVPAGRDERGDETRTSDDATGNRDGGGERNERDRSDESDTAATTPTNDRPDRENRGRREKS